MAHSRGPRTAIATVKLPTDIALDYTYYFVSPGEPLYRLRRRQTRMGPSDARTTAEAFIASDPVIKEPVYVYDPSRTFRARGQLHRTFAGAFRPPSLLRP